MIPLLLWACGGTPAPQDATTPVELHASLQAAKVPADQPIVVTIDAWTAEGWTIQPSEPSAEGLDASLLADDAPVQDGERIHHSWRYALQGPAGSYVIDPGDAVATGPDGTPQTLDPEALFADLGVKGPSGGPMADWQTIPPDEGPPWAWIAGTAGAIALLGALGAGALWLRRRPKPSPPPEPPAVIARREWDLARQAELEDHPLAVRLSLIFRRYLEATLGWPATARTASEILGFLEHQGRLGIADRLRAGHILDATDRLKFAREGGGEAFFAALDDDLEAILQATAEPTPQPEATDA